MSGPWEDYRVGQDIPDPRTGQPVTVSNVSRQQPQFGDVQTGPDTFVRPPWEDVVANDPLTQGGAMDQALQLRPGESRRYRNENGDLTVVRPVEKPNRALWAGWGDFGQSGRQGGLEGVAATLGSLGDYTGFLRDMWDTGGKVTGDFDYEANPYRGAAEAIPGSRDVLSRLQENTGIAPYEPQSIAGDYARTGGQFSIGLLGGPEAVVPTVASAAASETAGQGARALGASPEAEMGARAAAGFAGGFVQPGRSLGMFNRAARGMSEAEIAQTEALMQQAQAQGVPITVAEAAQQVTNGRTGLGRVQRLAEGTAEGQRAMSGMMAERPQAVRDAFFRALDDVAPATDTPSMVGPQAQRAAQGTLDQVRQRINESADPLYARLPGQTMDPADYSTLESNPSWARAVERFRSDPELSAPYAGAPDNDLSVINEILKQLDTDITGAQQTIANPGGNNRLAQLRGDVRGQAADLAELASPDFARARETVRTGHSAFLDPLEAGPLGDIARPDRLEAQTRGLFPQVPSEGRAAETALALRLMNEVDPAAGPALTRQNLATMFNESAQDLSAGPNPWGGAAFAAKAAGNAEQRANLQAALSQTGGEQSVTELMDVLRATGRRQAPGSLTAFNNADLEALRGTSALVDATKGVPIIRTIGNMIEQANASRNASVLADALLSDPATAATLLRRAQGGDPAPLVRALALGGYAGLEER